MGWPLELPSPPSCSVVPHLLQGLELGLCVSHPGDTELPEGVRGLERDLGPRGQGLWLHRPGLYSLRTEARKYTPTNKVWPTEQSLLEPCSSGLLEPRRPSLGLYRFPVLQLSRSSAPSQTAALEEWFSQIPKDRISGLPTTFVAKRFQLWSLGFFCTEHHLAKRLKSNSFYPFQQQQPDVFVLEYYLDTLWKGALLFVICILLISCDILKEVKKQEIWCFSAFGMCVGLWLMISSLPRRRLVLNHTRGVYHFSIRGRTVCQGPMHLVYVRLALSSDAYGRCFYQLVFCGHKLEPLVLVQLSERYEQMEFLGRHIARKLNINYFDYLASSYRHVVRHWPVGATFNPGIVQRKARTYTKPSVSDLDV